MSEREETNVDLTEVIIEAPEVPGPTFERDVDYARLQEIRGSKTFANLRDRLKNDSVAEIEPTL